MSEPFGGQLMALDDLEDLFAAIRRQALFRYSAGEASLVLQLEEEVRRRFAAPYALMTTSCTQSLRLALLATRPTPGDAVYMPCVTFLATANAVLSCGLVPVLVDVDPQFQIDWTKVPPHAERIIAVHFDGATCPIPDRKATIIEDAAQAFGAKLPCGDLVGARGRSTAFSFSPGKLLTAGQGGLLLCREAETYRLARSYHDHGVERAPGARPTWPEDARFGENMIANELQAAVLLQQLRRYEEIIARLEASYAAAHEILSGLQGAEIMPRGSGDLKLNLRLRFPSPKVKARVASALAATQLPYNAYDRYFLAANPVIRNHGSIFADGFPWSLSRSPPQRPSDFPNARELVDSTLALPLHVGLTPEEARIQARRYVECLASLPT